MKHAYLLAAALSLISTAALAADPLRDAFDNSFSWLQANSMVHGRIISDRDHPLHLQKSKLIPAPAGLKSDDIGYVLKEPLLGSPAYLSPDKQQIYALSDDGHLRSSEIGQPYAGRYEYVFTKVKDGYAYVQLAPMIENIDAAEALMSMYESTEDKAYLADAATILKELYKQVDSSGKLMTMWANEDKPRYAQGMGQGMLLFALDTYKNLSGDKWAADAALHMAEGFEHTTEGTWNHWTNSFIGLLTASKYVKIDEDFIAARRKEAERFAKQIEERHGEIPYIMDPKNDKWPAHKATYQTYDNYLVLRLAELDPGTKVWVCKDFPSMFDNSVEVNYGPYRANNVRSAVLAHEVCGIDTSDFLTKIKTPSEVDSMTSAVSNLVIFSSLRSLEVD